jgi:hypothetical protein
VVCGERYDLICFSVKWLLRSSVAALCALSLWSRCGAAQDSNIYKKSILSLKLNHHSHPIVKNFWNILHEKRLPYQTTLFLHHDLSPNTCTKITDLLVMVAVVFAFFTENRKKCVINFSKYTPKRKLLSS